MPRFAVVQNGTELARQTDADITDVFEQCCASLSSDGADFDSQIFTDGSVRFLLDRLDPGEFACLVFSSNALTSVPIAQAVEACHDELQRYFADGGGLVVLHQLVDSIGSVLPDDANVIMTDRVARRRAVSVKTNDPVDVLLHYPTAVVLAGFVDGGFKFGPPSLFYKSLTIDSIPEQIKPVLVDRTEVLVCRTYDHVRGRLVLSTLPLDWQRQIGLLGNAIRFASLGVPRRLVWQAPSASGREPLTRWLTSDGQSSVRALPEAAEHVDPTDRWLLGHVDVAVVPSDRRADIEARTELQVFLAQGGTLLAFDDTWHRHGSEVRALVGGFTERRLSRQLYGELRAVRGWNAVDYAFELRNIVTCLGFLAPNHAEHQEGTMMLGELADLVPKLEARLRDAHHREDLSSSIAHGQSLTLLLGSVPVKDDLLAWMATDPRYDRPDVALQVRAVRALGRHEADPSFLSDADESIRRGGIVSPLPGVLRVLDTVALLDQAGLLTNDPCDAATLATTVCSILDQHAADDQIGWLSVEATADAARGLVALLDHLDPADVEVASRLTDHVARAATVLRPAVGRYERNRKGVAWLARVTQAIVLIDRHFPVGLHRMATLPWPESSAEELALASEAERSLIEHLAAENKALREKERDLERTRLAATIGRAAATLAAVALIAAPLVYVMLRLGWDSVWTLVANITVVVAVVLGVVSLAFSWLDKRALLAGPAVRVHKLVGQGLDVLVGITKLRAK